MAQDTELGGLVLGGKYRLVRRIGETVPAFYEVRHPRLAGRFAARLWPPTIPWDEFRRGAEIAATLRHPGVVQVIDFNCEPGASPFLVMEWLDGTRLSDLLAGSGLLPVPRVAALVESAAWALASAHQQGVVHQELDPEQIFVVQAAGTTREWTKLDGFGVAAALVRAGAEPASFYRAPEQAAPDDGEGADPQSDQYALAAIAYEMLAGVRPLERSAGAPDGRSDLEPAPISDLAPDVTPAVDMVIRQALAAEPEERFPGVLEFARALRDAAQGVSTQVVRRRKLEGRPGARAKSASDAPVSPFFNPIQSPSFEGLRPLASAAFWRAAPRALLALLPVGASARIAVALGALLLAFGGIAVMLRSPPPRATARMASMRAAPASATPRAATPKPAPAPTLAAAPVTTPAPVVLPPPVVMVRPTVMPPPTSVAPPTVMPPPPATYARAMTPAPATTPAPAMTPAPAVAPAPAVTPNPASTAAATPASRPAVVRRARPARPASVPAPATAAASAPAAVPCVISVSSKPWAEVWIDERNVGRRTPLADYRVACGDHKLVLKRGDLDIYQMEVITVRAGVPFKKSYPLQ